jgi:hypothetical protein
MAVADRVVRLDEGRIVAVGPATVVDGAAA